MAYDKRNNIFVTNRWSHREQGNQYNVVLSKHKGACVNFTAHEIDERKDT